MDLDGMFKILCCEYFRRDQISSKFKINNTSSIQFWNQFIEVMNFIFNFISSTKKGTFKKLSPYIGNKIAFILMLEHISLVGTLSWIKLLVKYTIAIQMLNKCIIKAGRPMGSWRHTALHWECPHLDSGDQRSVSHPMPRPPSASELASGQMRPAMIVIWSQLWLVMMWERQPGAAEDNNFCNCYDHYYWTSSM